MFVLTEKMDQKMVSVLETPDYPLVCYVHSCLCMKTVHMDSIIEIESWMKNTIGLLFSLKSALGDI